MVISCCGVRGMSAVTVDGYVVWLAVRVVPVSQGVPVRPERVASGNNHLPLSFLHQANDTSDNLFSIEQRHLAS